MKLPRMTVLSVMAGAAVVALDCAAFRSLASRPEFLTGEARWAALLALPMANVLAVMAALRMRGRGPGRPFSLGFEVAGWAAVVAMIPLQETCFWVVESVLTALGLVAWLEASSLRVAIVTYAVIPAVGLAGQLAIATLGGLAARMAWRGPAPAAPTRRSRLVAGAGLVLLAAIPFLAIEGYLRAEVDPRLVRLDRDTRAEVDFAQIPDFPIRPPKGSPIESLDGSRVRIVSDGEAMVPERCMSANGVEHFRDHRAVSVTMIHGDRAGEIVRVPHCVLRTVP